MTSTKRVRWGVLGTGWVAQRFMADLRCVEGAVLGAVASRTESRAREIAKRFAMRSAHSNYEALFAAPDIDVIYVATSPHEHAEHCMAALKQGKHVLCEKPFSVSVEQAQRVIEFAQNQGLFCMEALWTRFLPAIAQTIHHIDKGDVGAPRTLTADFGIPTQTEGPNRLFDLTRGGGALLDRGVYALSLAVWLFGKPLQVSSIAQTESNGTDFQVSSMLEFADSRSALISASLRDYSSNEAVISGTAGRIRLHEPFYRPERITISRAPILVSGHSDLRPHSPKENLRKIVSRAKSYLPADVLRSKTEHHSVQGYGYVYEAREVTRCIQEGLTESPLLPLRSTLTVMQTVQTIRSQIERRR